MITLRILPTCLIAVLYFVSAPVTFAQELTRPARDERKDLIAALAAKSELIVVAEVTHNKPQWFRRSIVTVSEVTPLMVLKGDASGRPLRVMFFGGTIGVINQEFTHEATLREGEVAVLFLKRSHDEASRALQASRIVGEEGKLPLLDPGQSKTRLENNKRLIRFLDDLKAIVAQGGPRP